LLLLSFSEITQPSSKPLSDRVEETLQSASLKFMQDLIHQKHFEEFKQALTLIKITNNLKLLQLNLRFAIATKNDKNEESLDKVKLFTLMAVFGILNVVLLLKFESVIDL
jgi:hypothetical protein